VHEYNRIEVIREDVKRAIEEAGITGPHFEVGLV